MFSMGWIESGQKVTQVKLPITGPLCQVLLEHLYTDLEAIPNRYNFLREIDFGSQNLKFLLFVQAWNFSFRKFLFSVQG